MMQVSGLTFAVPGRGGARRPIGIRALLEWAFQREFASVDFDEIATVSGGTLPGYGMEYRMIERAKLGCRVDGGGRSDPHPDADLVASALAALPEHCGGRQMALCVADHARAGTAPDWSFAPPPSIIPADTRFNQHGEFAVTTDAAPLGSFGWPPQVRRNRKGAVVHDVVLYCPVRILNDPARAGQRMAAQRRAYLAWWGALMELRQTFRRCRFDGGLSAFEVTEDMPILEPWKENA